MRRKGQRIGGRTVKLLVQWVISVVAIAITVRIVPGISVVGEEWKGLAIAAIMLGLANLLIRPVLTLITAPITVVTLGLFWFVIGGIVLAASSWLSLRCFDAGIVIDGSSPPSWGRLSSASSLGRWGIPRARLIAPHLSPVPSLARGVQWGRLCAKAKGGMAMGGVIGETLPLGLGIALIPLPLSSPFSFLARSIPKNGVAFAFGWIWA